MANENKTVTIAATGDTVCRAIGGGDPFGATRDVLARADLRFTNLETVLTAREPTARKWVRLRTDPAEAKYLYADAVNVAHNHAFDCGALGFLDTLAHLENRNILAVGAGKAAFLRANGLAVAFVGFHAYPLSANGLAVEDCEDEGAALHKVHMLRTLADATIVSVHWGTEHAPHPSPAQAAFAHALVDAGACLVLGHHPHRVQAFERYGNGLIAYSLGNFNFLQPDVAGEWFNRLSVILLAEVGRQGVVSYESVPVWIDDLGVPKPMDSPAARWASSHFSGLATDVPWEAWYKEIGERYIRQSLRSFAVTIPRYGFVRIKKLLWWLRQAHTRKAVAGMVRNWLKK